jgi:hypothetical protein
MGLRVVMEANGTASTISGSSATYSGGGGGAMVEPLWRLVVQAVVAVADGGSLELEQ